MEGVIVLDSWTNTTEPDISSLLLTIIIILLLLCFLALDKRGWPILIIGIIFLSWYANSKEKKFRHRFHC